MVLGPGEIPKISARADLCVEQQSLATFLQNIMGGKTGYKCKTVDT
jgi:hypothetical protein